MAIFCRWWCVSSLSLAVLLMSGCQLFIGEKQEVNSSKVNRSSLSKRIPTVDVAIADIAEEDNYREYIGTTEPQTLAVLRSQVEGRLLSLQVNIGDGVEQNQVIGRLDDSLLAATVQQEQAELASIKSELVQQQLSIKNAQISLQEAKINLQQAQSDAQRYNSLAEIGAISQQQAESFATAAKVAQQTVLLAEEEVKIAQQAATTAQGRVAVQQAAIAEVAQRRAYSLLTAPITGIVVSKSQEPGNLVRQGEEIVSIGNFKAVKISVPISAVDLNLISIGQRVEVKLDAIDNRVFYGKITKIAPVANSDTRKITIEIMVANPNNQIKGGLLAKIQIPKTNQQQVSVPSSAITEEAENSYIFVVAKENSKQKQATVAKRLVETDTSSQNQVFITQGLKPGERYVVRSSQPLSDRELVNLSILSD